jgi:hypothetical protein
VKSLLIWFGGLELPILVPVNENQTGTWYDLRTSITGINIYVFDEPDPELDSWFHLCVRPEPEVLDKSKEPPTLEKHP